MLCHTQHVPFSPCAGCDGTDAHEQAVDQLSSHQETPLFDLLGEECSRRKESGCTTLQSSSEKVLLASCFGSRWA